MLKRLTTGLLASLCCITALASSLTDNRTPLRRLLNKAEYSVNEKSMVLTLAESVPGLQMAADDIRRGRCISTEAAMRMMAALEEACKHENLTDDEEYLLILAECTNICFNSFDDRAFSYRTLLNSSISENVSDPMQRYLWMSYDQLIYPDWLVMGWQYYSDAVNSDIYARHLIAVMNDIKIDSDMKFQLAYEFLTRARNQNYQCDFLPRLSSQLKDYARKNFGDTGMYQRLLIDELADKAALTKNPASSLAKLEAMRRTLASNPDMQLYLLGTMFGAYMTNQQPDKALQCSMAAQQIAQHQLNDTHTVASVYDDPNNGINYVEDLGQVATQITAIAMLQLQQGNPENFDSLWTELLQKFQNAKSSREQNMMRFILLDGLINCDAWYEDFGNKFGNDIQNLLTTPPNFLDNPATNDMSTYQAARYKFINTGKSPFYILTKYNILLLQYRSGMIGDQQQTEQMVGNMMSELSISAKALRLKNQRWTDLNIKKNMADALLASTEAVAVHWGTEAAQQRSVQLDSFLIANKFRHHQLGLYSILARLSFKNDSVVCRHNLNAYRNVRQSMTAPEFAFKSDWDLAHIFAVNIQTGDPDKDDDACIAEMERLIDIALKQQDRNRVVKLCSEIALDYAALVTRRTDALTKANHYLQIGWQAAISEQNADDILGIAESLLSFLKFTGDFSQYYKIYNDVNYVVEHSNWVQDPRYLRLLAAILTDASDRGNIELGSQVMVKLSNLTMQFYNTEMNDRTRMQCFLHYMPATIHFCSSIITQNGGRSDDLNLSQWEETIRHIGDEFGLSDVGVQNLYYEWGQLQLALGNTDRAAAIADTLYATNTLYKGEARDFPLTLRIGIAQRRGDFKEMSRLLAINLSGYETALANGMNINDVSSIYNSLILIQKFNANYQEAMELAAKRYSLMRDYINSSYAALNESERYSLTQSGNASGHDIFELLPYTNDSKSRQLAYDATLTFKNIQLISDNMARRAIYSSGNPDLVAKYEQSRQLRFWLSGQYDVNSQMESITQKFNDLRRLEDDIEDACPALANLKLKQSTGWRDVQRTLGNKDVAVEYIMHYDHNDKLQHYSAMVLRKGDDAPIFVPLTTKPKLEQLLSLATKAVKQETGVNRTYRYNQSGRELYSKVWAPLEPYLEGVENVYFAPTGQLSYIAFAAIEDSTGTPLCQRYSLHQLSSTAQVCQLNGNDRRKGTDVPTYGLVGGIRYDADPAKASNRLRNWAYLPESRTEIDFIDSLYRANFNIAPKRLHELEATEAELRAMSGHSPRILQLCTHGFYSSAEQASRQPFFINKGLTNDSVPNTAIQPLKRGGIILADANTVWNNEGQRDDEADGVLTSEELSNLDLSNTELAVLSACETGLGEYSSTEGINGLQRGLKLAGVKSIIMTLWRVNDHASSEFMQRLHSHIIVDRQQARLAFHNTQREMQSQYPNRPYLWAPFILLD